MWRSKHARYVKPGLVLAFMLLVPVLVQGAKSSELLIIPGGCSTLKFKSGDEQGKRPNRVDNGPIRPCGINADSTER